MFELTVSQIRDLAGMIASADVSKVALRSTGFGVSLFIIQATLELRRFKVERARVAMHNLSSGVDDFRPLVPGFVEGIRS